MGDRDDDIMDWDDQDGGITSTGKEHDQFGSDGSENHSVTTRSDDSSFDDGESDLCPDYINPDD